MDNKLKYKIGDKFISLVGNHFYAGFEIGDIITISGIAESKMPYFLTKENGTKKGWWYSDETIKEFTIPYTPEHEKEIFVYRLTGNFPGRKTYVYGIEDHVWESIYTRGEAQ